MRVQSVPSDSSGCGFYRSFLPAAALGDDVVVHPHIEVEWDRDGNVADAWPAVEDVDVVAVHRPMGRGIVQALKVLQGKGYGVAVDVDDDLAAIPKGIPSWDPAQPHVNPNENWHWFTRAAQFADVVTVSTPALLDRYGKHGRAMVVPNTVPADLLAVSRVEGDPLVVGWSGSPSHHPYDLEVPAGEVGRAVEEAGATFHTVGAAETLERFAVQGTWEPWVPIDRYLQTVAARFDVGVVPLADSQFNRAKSWLKGLELAALGIPFVASPTPEYRRLGVGLLAKRPRDWRRHLTGLLTDAGLRAEAAGRGRERAAELTVEGNAHLWWEAWERAAKRRAVAR